MALSAADYTDMLLALLPPGPAWPKEDSQTARLCAGWAREMARLDVRADRLIEEADPRTTRELLPDWERVAGLPETCPEAEANLTIAQRRGLLVAKLISTGGQSPQYYIDVAAALGYEITITEFIPSRIGRIRVGDRLQDADIAYTWQINAASTTVQYARVGSARVGDRLASWGNALLECVMRRIAPAHTVLIFSYT